MCSEDTESHSLQSPRRTYFDKKQKSCIEKKNVLVFPPAWFFKLSNVHACTSSGNNYGLGSKEVKKKKATSIKQSMTISLTQSPMWGSCVWTIHPPCPPLPNNDIGVRVHKLCDYFTNCSDPGLENTSWKKVTVLVSLKLRAENF